MAGIANLHLVIITVFVLTRKKFLKYNMRV